MSEMIIAEGLTKRFNDFTAVEHINMHVSAGEVLVILGPNGAGETTTIRLLTSVLTPTSGGARVAGYDVVTQANKVRQSVGVLTEHHGLYGRMTAEEYLIFFGQLYGLSPESSKRRTLSLLEWFGLSDVNHKRLSEFSRGMRQKLALVRALLHEPPVLLLDEPTTAMDPESSRLVRNMISGLRSSDRAIILCTHNLAEAEELADRIAIMRDGKILAQGTPEEIKRSVLGAPEYLACLADPVSLNRPAFPSGVELVDGGPDWLRFRIDAPDKTNSILIQELLDHGAALVAFQEIPYRLEDAYLHLIQQSDRPIDRPRVVC